MHRFEVHGLTRTRTVFAVYKDVHVFIDGIELEIDGPVIVRQTS